MIDQHTDWTLHCVPKPTNTNNKKMFTVKQYSSIALKTLNT